MITPRVRCDRLPPTPRAAEAARRCLVALPFAVALTIVGVGAALTATSSVVVLAIFEACGVVYPLAALLLLELGPAVIELWRVKTRARRATQRFRKQLDALPETPHPLGA
jgi:hypothetical protein